MSIGSWLEKIVISRYVKSAIRYVLVAFATYLQVQGQFIPELLAVSELISVNLPLLIDAITAVIVFVVAGWSVTKNVKNAKVSLTTK